VPRRVFHLPSKTSHGRKGRSFAKPIMNYQAAMKRCTLFCVVTGNVTIVGIVYAGTVSGLRHPGACLGFYNTNQSLSFISHERLNPRRIYTPLPIELACNLISSYPFLLAHFTPSSTILEARPRPRHLGSVYIERRKGCTKCCTPGRETIGRNHTIPPATISPTRVSATHPTTLPAFNFDRNQPRKIRLSSTSFALFFSPISVHMDWRWRTSMSRSRSDTGRSLTRAFSGLRDLGSNLSSNLH